MNYMASDVKYFFVCGLMMPAFLLAGCVSLKEEAVKEQTGCSFKVRTRGTTDNAPDDAVQYTQLYVAERLQEHDADHLHCAIDRRYKLTGGEYALTDLYGQWYKFAFVCVPQWTDGGGAALLTEETPVDKTCDYNKLLIDFSPVLTYQKNNVNIAQSADLNIYRQVIDRWIDPDATNTEDVELKRLTGELQIDMGIPADQFEYDVKSIRLTLQAPAEKVYVRDGSNDEVTTVAGTADIVYTLDFSSLSDGAYETAMASHQMFRLCLLPDVLSGSISVTFKGTTSSLTLPLGTGADETSVEVRKNRVTTVLYNGMQKNEFEVRYAGFAAGGDSQVDVNDDEWNGW